MDRDIIEKIKEKEFDEAKRKSRLAYDMETAESIIFDDINEDYNLDSSLDWDTILDNDYD